MRRLRTLCFALVVCLAVVGVAVTPVLGAKAGGRKPKMQKVSLLYAVEAGSGSLSGKGANLTLTLRGTDEVVWFSDRPARRSGDFPSSDLPNSWKGFGFTSDPPNAALAYDDPSKGIQRTVVLTLGKPTVAGSSLRFPAKVIDPKRAGPNLEAHSIGADRDPAAKFGHASLFIDDGEAPVAGNCTLQPNENCSELALQRVELANMDLHGLWIVEGLYDYDLEATGTNFEGAHFVNTDISNSDFDATNFNQAELINVEMSNSNMSGTEFNGANLTGSNLSGAEPAEAQFKGAILCHTTMPNGSVDNSGC